MPIADSFCTTKANNMLYPVLFAEPADAIGHESGLELSSDCKLSSKMFIALNSQKITSYSFHNDQGELGLRLIQPVYHGNNDIGSSLRGYIVGIVMIKDSNINVSEVIRNADIAMYEAKRLGRGKIVFYQNDMYKSLVYRQGIENDLAEAINTNGLSLYLQPIHNLNGLVGFEALSRWQHPEKGMIFPDEFISVAEETGLIHQLGYWLLEESCQYLSMWINQYGIDDCPYISVNFSPIQLENTQIVNQIEAALKRYKIPEKLLAVELTESALIGNKKIVKDNLIKLRALNVRVFLDDFGTGYSSLSLLKDFPIDVLKIDRSFITGVDQASEDSQNLVKAIINMTHALNMKVVAEGVETNSVLNWLLNVQCDLVQGYYFSKPLSEQQLPLYLDSYQFRQQSVS